MSALRRILQRASATLPGPRDGVVVLTYHLVEGGTETPIDLPLSVFRRQMEQVRELTCSLEAAVAHLAQGRPGTKVVVTFDDAFENFHASAWPTLLALEIPAVLYVPTDFVDGRGPSPLRGAAGLPPCSWEQLRAMSSTGLLTVGSHGRSHAELTSLSQEAVIEELTTSRARIEAELGRAPTSFCYPRGRCSDRVARAVRERYATAVVRGGAKATSRSWSPWALERVPVRRDTPADLAAVLSARVWLEEWVADHVSALRRGRTAP